MQGAATNSSEAKQTMMNQGERGLRKEEEEEWQELESSAFNGVDRWFSTVQIYDITVGDWSRPHASPFLNLLLFFSIFIFCFPFVFNLRLPLLELTKRTSINMSLLHGLPIICTICLEFSARFWPTNHSNGVIESKTESRVTCRLKLKFERAVSK